MKKAQCGECGRSGGYALYCLRCAEEMLKQSEQEPVAWHYPGGKPDQCTTDKAYAEKDPAWTPMYYKHEWVSLTDEEIYGIGFDINVGGLQTMKAYKAIEAKLKEKNGG